MITAFNNCFKIENSLFCREVQVDTDGLRTVSLLNKNSGRDYVRNPEVAEFQFSIDGQVVRSYQKPVCLVRDGTKIDSQIHLKFLGHRITPGRQSSEILELQFQLVRHLAQVKVCYEIHPDLAGCIKWLEITALTNDLHISNCFFEILSICPGTFTDGAFYGQQGLRRMPPMFAACGDEDILQFHDERLNEGFWLGNGAQGPLRFFMVYPNWPEAIACGYSMSTGDFNAYLQKGQTLVTDKAYLCLYTGDRNGVAHRNRFREMLRRDLPACPDPGTVMYCTWIPFLKNINETLLCELADVAGTLGFGSFLVDDGWFAGNWTVDTTKFPCGLGIVVDRVKSARMRFGLWYSLGANMHEIGVRPENHSLDSCGRPKKLGWNDCPTWCLASGHRDVATKELLELAARHKVDYFKLDFSSILSPYGVLPPGCCSTQHPHHRNGLDSVWEQYRALGFIRDQVKTRFPDTMIDFSFECIGTQAPGIAALRLSEWHHASNMCTNESEAYQARTIRNTLYSFGTVLPIERIMGSLMCLQGDNDVENLLTTFVGAPLVAGDLRRIPDTKRKVLTTLCARYNDILLGGALTEFCTLRDDRAIDFGDWDGFARYRRDGTGMICIFRNESGSQAAEVTIPDLPAEIDYQLTDALSGDDLGMWTGTEFRAGRHLAFLTESNCRAVMFHAAGSGEKTLRKTD